MKRLAPLMFVLFFACDQPRKEQPAEWVGSWTATWETDPALYEGMKGITDFSMPGKVTFEEKNVTIEAYGFEGCVFSKDTLKHSLAWKVKNDSLVLINDENTPGMVYKINGVSADEIRLQLMDDIFLTLNK